MLCLGQVSMQPVRPNLAGLAHNTAQENVNRATPPFLTIEEIRRLYFLFVPSPIRGVPGSEMVLHIKRRIDEEWQQRQSGDRSRREQALWAGLDKQLSNLEVDDVGVLPRVKQKYKKDKADREEKTDKPESTIKKDKKKEDTSRNDDKMPMYRPLHIENNDDDDDDEEMPRYPQLWRD